MSSANRRHPLVIISLFLLGWITLAPGAEALRDAYYAMCLIASIYDARLSFSPVVQAWLRSRFQVALLILALQQPILRASAEVLRKIPAYPWMFFFERWFNLRLPARWTTFARWRKVSVRL